MRILINLGRGTAFVMPTEKGGTPPASLTLRRLEEGEDDLFDDVGPIIFVSGFEVADKGRGVGRALMAAFLDAIDGAGEAVALVPAASGGMRQAALVAWYERLGFVNMYDYMLRPAKVAVDDLPF